MLAIHRVGMNKQDRARTVEEAKRLFDQSCNICIYRGIKLDCDQCPLEAYHHMNVAAIRDNEMLKKQEEKSQKPIEFELESNLQSDISYTKLNTNQITLNDMNASIDKLKKYIADISKSSLIDCEI